MTQILEALKIYTPTDELEKKDVQRTTAFIESGINCFDLSNLEGHVTGSAFVINSAGDKALLMHHKKLGIWVQPGGHSDGNEGTWDVAMREVMEETGLSDVDFVTRDVFDVDIQQIPFNAIKSEPAHVHYDIRFLIQSKNDTLTMNGESLDLRWLSLTDLEDFPIGSEVWRMVHKWQNLNK